MVFLKHCYLFRKHTYHKQTSLMVGDSNVLDIIKCLILFQGCVVTQASTLSASFPAPRFCRHYSKSLFCYNRVQHLSPVSVYHKTSHCFITNDGCKTTPTFNGKRFFFFKNVPSQRYRLQMCATVDVATAVDVINDLGMDTLTFLAVTVLVVPAFKMIRASPVSWFHIWILFLFYRTLLYERLYSSNCFRYLASSLRE